MPYKYVLDNPSEMVSANTPVPEVGYQYQQLINSNPYRNAQYKESTWQKILSKLGFRTGADAWKENMAVQANEYDASILQKAYNEDYNDPVSQVARMKAAGINPDLDPSSIDSGEASPMPEDPSTPMQSSGSEAQFTSFFGNLFDAFDSLIGMTSGIQGIVGKNIQNRILNSQYESEFANNAIAMSDMFLPDSLHPQGIQNYDWRAEAASNMDKYIDKHYRSAKDRQKFKDIVNQYWDSAIGKAATFEEMRSYIESRKGLALEEQTNWSDLDSVLFQITEPLASNQEDIIRLNQEVQKLQLEYEKSYRSNLDPEIQAEAANTTAEYQSEFNQALDPTVQASSQNVSASVQAQLQKVMAEYQEVLNKTQKETLERLAKHARKRGPEGWYYRHLFNRAMINMLGGSSDASDISNLAGVATDAVKAGAAAAKAGL